MLAAIVRNIAIPATELGVGTPPPPAPPATVVAENAAPRAAATAPTVRPAPVVAPAKSEPAKPEPKPAEAKKPAAKKPEPRKPEPKKPEPKKLVEPARWWVQVAGGATVADLPKAWNALAGKSTLLKGRQAWTTPLRFTNRLLTGPFKSAGEAQALVNKLGGAGLSAFTFESEAGQKVARLPAR